MATNHNHTEKRLWDAADQLRANSPLRAAEYSVPVLGLIFLRYADHKFTHIEEELADKSAGRREIGKVDYQARAAVRVSIEEILDGLPRAYTPSIYKQKCDAVYQHVYESYFGQGKSIYSAVS